MRQILRPVVVAAALAITASCGASAQSIVDLSKPQSGKSRFVLNADLTPADLGIAAAAEKPVPVAAAGRVPACGEGCTMEQPLVQPEARSARAGFPVFSPIDQERARAHVIANARMIQKATQDGAPKRSRARRR